MHNHDILLTDVQTCLHRILDVIMIFIQTMYEDMDI